MKIAIKGTNLDLTDALKDYVDEKVGGLERFVESILEARVELERLPHHQKGPVFRCEVNLEVPQKHVLRAESTQEDLYAAIDTVIPKLKEQIETYKSKGERKDRRMKRYLKSIFPWRTKK
jgi:putative sigma-54 modulation protein